VQINLALQNAIRAFVRALGLSLHDIDPDILKSAALNPTKSSSHMKEPSWRSRTSIRAAKDLLHEAVQNYRAFPSVATFEQMTRCREEVANRKKLRASARTHEAEISSSPKFSSPSTTNGYLQGTPVDPSAATASRPPEPTRTELRLASHSSPQETHVNPSSVLPDTLDTQANSLETQPPLNGGQAPAVSHVAAPKIVTSHPSQNLPSIRPAPPPIPRRPTIHQSDQAETTPAPPVVGRQSPERANISRHLAHLNQAPPSTSTGAVGPPSPPRLPPRRSYLGMLPRFLQPKPARPPSSA
jgi:hypothetical protein